MMSFSKKVYPENPGYVTLRGMFQGIQYENTSLSTKYHPQKVMELLFNYFSEKYNIKESSKYYKITMTYKESNDITVEIGIHYEEAPENIPYYKESDLRFLDEKFRTEMVENLNHYAPVPYYSYYIIIYDDGYVMRALDDEESPSSEKGKKVRDDVFQTMEKINDDCSYNITPTVK